MDDEDPFAVDTSAAEKAVPLSPKPAKGQTFKVVCPMCETAGYAPPKAAGGEVRCANSDCMVPIFTAPELPQEKPAAEPEKPRRSKVVPAVAVVALAVLIGVGVWHFGFRRDDSPPPGPRIGGNSGSDESSASSDTDRQDDALSADDSGTDQTGRNSNRGEPATPAEIRASALAAMIDASRRRENNRSKRFCLGLTAEAYAIENDLDGARRQLRLMGREVLFYRIQPLVEIAWRELEAGDDAAARQSLDEAVTAARELRARGRTRPDLAVELAGALAATDRIAEAVALIKEHQQTSAEGRLSAEIAVVRANRSFDLDAAPDEAPIVPWAAPQTVAVARSLVARGHADAALTWALGQPTPEVNSEAVVAWADAIARRTSAAESPLDSARWEAAADRLPAAGRARLYARLADRLRAAGRGSEAEALLSKARVALAALPPPAEFVLPDMKGLKDLKTPDLVPLRIRALAAAEIARTEAADRGRSAEAWAACQLAMRYLRGSAPSPSAIRIPLDEIAEQEDLVRDRLRRALKLNSEDAARLAFNDYRYNCRRLNEAARERFAAQEAVLAAAAEWGLRDQVWKEIEPRAQHAELDRREPWLSTRVPWILRDGFAETGDNATTGTVDAALRAAAAHRPPGEAMAGAAWKLISEGQPQQAARQFESRDASDVPQGVRDRWRMRFACRLVARRQIDPAFEFIGAISQNDAVLREEALRMISALAARSGHAQTIWKIGQKRTWSATEVVSIYRGLIEGFDAVRSPGTTAAQDSGPATNRGGQPAGSS